MRIQANDFKLLNLFVERIGAAKNAHIEQWLDTRTHEVLTSFFQLLLGQRGRLGIRLRRFQRLEPVQTGELDQYSLVWIEVEPMRIADLLLDGRQPADVWPELDKKDELLADWSLKPLLTALDLSEFRNELDAAYTVTSQNLIRMVNELKTCQTVMSACAVLNRFHLINRRGIALIWQPA